MRLVTAVLLGILACKPRQEQAAKLLTDTNDMRYFRYLEDCEDALGKPPKLDCFAENTVEIPTEWVKHKGKHYCARPMYANYLRDEDLEHCNYGSRVGRWTVKDTEWVLLCRKTNPDQDTFSEINVIGYENQKKATCFFNSSLKEQATNRKIPGSKIPGFHDVKYWHNFGSRNSSTMYCTDCHQNRPFLVTPWIAAAKDKSGQQIVPSIDDSELWIPTDAFLGSIYFESFRLKKSTDKKENKCQSCHEIGYHSYMSYLVPAALAFDSPWHRLADKETLGRSEVAIPESEEHFRTFHWMPSSSSSQLLPHAYSSRKALIDEHLATFWRMKKCYEIGPRGPDSCFEPTLYFGRSSPVIAPNTWGNHKRPFEE